MEKLPPTQDALLQHIRRALTVHQAGYGQPAHRPAQQVVPSPQDYVRTQAIGKHLDHGRLLGCHFQESPEQAGAHQMLLMRQMQI